MNNYSCMKNGVTFQTYKVVLYKGEEKRKKTEG